MKLSAATVQILVSLTLSVCSPSLMAQRPSAAHWPLDQVQCPRACTQETAGCNTCPHTYSSNSSYSSSRNSGTTVNSNRRRRDFNGNSRVRFSRDRPRAGTG